MYEDQSHSGEPSPEQRAADAEGEVSRILLRIGDGDHVAVDELFTLVYDELYRLARRAMRGQNADHSLQATALVGEAYLKLFGNTGRMQGREHFLRAAARAMRTVLVDHARGGSRRKREPPGERVLLDEVTEEYGESAGDLVGLDESLTRLAEFDPDMVRLVELRFFTGLSVSDAAEVLGISERKAAREWATARAWLRRELE